MLAVVTLIYSVVVLESSLLHSSLFSSPDWREVEVGEDKE